MEVDVECVKGYFEIFNFNLFSFVFIQKQNILSLTS